MSTTEIKICGLSAPEQMHAAVEAGADYVGLMFYEPSPRNVSVPVAQELAAIARNRSKIVAVLVDADDSLIDAINVSVKPDFFQAHGSETPARLAEITARTAVPVIKVIKVRDASDIETAADYADVADFILFDARAPDALADALPGGNGVAFDWSLLAGDAGQPRFMLSGGLNADNVAKAIAVTGAPMVDVSSGVESAPGNKDATAIVNFIEAVRQHG